MYSSGQPPAPLPQYPATAYRAPSDQTPLPKDLGVPAAVAFTLAGFATLLYLISAVTVGPALRRGLDSNSYGPIEAVYVFSTLLKIVAFLSAAVVAAWCLYRARRNAELLDYRFPHRLGRGWAWGGWFLPPVMFWFPYLVAQDTRQAVRPSAKRTLVGWWWTFYLTMLLGHWILGGVTRLNPDPTDAATVQTVAIVVGVLSTGTWLMWGLVLRAFTREQRERARNPNAR